ncbi:MAG: hypothetical protein ONB32_06465 [candidate division KSB1 bacterium]|nr:hypothetical protein [candidate division KSB1 bacterium]
MKIYWLTCVLAIIIISNGYSQFQHRYSQFERNFSLSVDSSTTVYSLPDSFLIRGSERIYRDSTKLYQGIDYQIDYSRGKLIWLKPIAGMQKLQIYYQFIPLPIRAQYFHRELMVYQPSDSSTPAVRSSIVSRRGASESASALRQNGSIVRGISIGSNQGLKLESGLRMQISGKIAEKLEVVAALTDQNTPIQPEGNTQTLQEIDKVFIQLKGEQFQSTLGDYYLSFEGTEFSPYNRKLQGVMGSFELGRTKGAISAAVSRGKFTTNFFLGQEGNQGPYQLKGDRGQIDIIVLAGTEKVWVDGQLMTRGENNDYVIEYSNGQITFTRHRLITADSRITVDFQYSDQKFQRSLYGIDVSTATDDERLKFGVRMLREADNKNNPLDYTLTEANRNRLQQAGDNRDSAFVSGVNYLGPGKGNYVAVDSAGVKFYRYVGPGLGDYNIGFNYVGPNNGSYQLAGYANYKYVGPGKGSYLPVIFLTPPESHDLIDLAFAYQPGKHFQIHTELAASRFDRNLISDRDDDDNFGMAMLARLGFKQQPIRIAGKKFGQFDLLGRIRRVHQQFQYIDRSEEVEKNRKWDLINLAPQSERIFELQGGYSPAEPLKITGALGENQRGDSFQSRRWEMGSEILFQKIPQLRYRIESISSDAPEQQRTSRWVRQFGSGRYSLWKLQSSLDFQAEQKQERFQDSMALGFRYYEIGPMLKLVDWHRMGVSFGISQRQQDKWDAGGFKRESEAITQTANWELRDWKRLSVAFQYTHRERNYSDPTVGRKLTDLADLRADYSALNQSITTNWYYQVSNTQVAKLERIPIKVERGQGDYRLNEDSTDYVYDPLFGDYILRVRATDAFVPVVELRASSTIKIQPELLWKQSKAPSRKMIQKWLSFISSETFVQLEEKTQETDVWSIYRLELSKFLNENATIFGTRNFRQDVYWGKNERRFSLRLRYNARLSLNNQYLEGKQNFNLIERELRVKSQLSPKLSAQLDYRRRHERKKYATALRDKNIVANEADLEWSYRPRQVLELAIKLRWSQAKNRIVAPIDVMLLAVAPQLSYSFQGKGRLRAELELNRVDASPKNALVPFEMASGNRSGTNLKWMTSLDYNVSRYLRASFSWNGRYEDYLNQPIYTLRAEMRAFF